MKNIESVYGSSSMVIAVTNDEGKAHRTVDFLSLTCLLSLWALKFIYLCLP